MVKDLDNGIRVVTLGERTTKVTQCVPSGEKYSDGIMFCNELPNPKGSEKRFHGDEVIISIKNFDGVVAYIKAIIELIKTWDINGTEEQLIILSEIISDYYKEKVTTTN